MSNGYRPLFLFSQPLFHTTSSSYFFTKLVQSPQITSAQSNARIHSQDLIGCTPMGSLFRTAKMAPRYRGHCGSYVKGSSTLRFVINAAGSIGHNPYSYDALRTDDMKMYNYLPPKRHDGNTSGAIRCNALHLATMAYRVLAPVLLLYYSKLFSSPGTDSANLISVDQHSVSLIFVPGI
jgi:hypothetical protein